jgi:hypothetical protein
MAPVDSGAFFFAAGIIQSSLMRQLRAFNREGREGDREGREDDVQSRF